MPSTNQMSETKPAWTPGPWKQSGVNPHRIIAAEGRSVGLDICTAKAFRAEYREQSLANARLIAAAPDMYEALRLLVDRYVSLASSGDCGFWDPEKEVQVVRARAALAKAEGRTNA